MTELLFALLLAYCVIDSERCVLYVLVNAEQSYRFLQDKFNHFNQKNQTKK